MSSHRLRLRFVPLAVLLVAAPFVAAKAPVAQKQEAAVVAANPIAVEAGLQILREGGSAVDAAVAIQAMLGLVEPQSSGIGGGAFMLHFDAASGVISSLDGREKAPAGATPDMFLDEHGKPMSYLQAVRTGRSGRSLRAGAGASGFSESGALRGAGAAARCSGASARAAG